MVLNGYRQSHRYQCLRELDANVPVKEQNRDVISVGRERNS